MNEYIITDKQKALELLKITEAQLDVEPDNQMQSYFKGIIFGLNQILSQSTPLIPEIEKAHNVGTNYGCYLQGGSCDHNDNIDSEKYISNLKLDI